MTRKNSESNLAQLQNQAPGPSPRLPMTHNAHQHRPASKRQAYDLAVGRRVKLIGIRTDDDGQAGTIFEVKRVAPIASGVGKKTTKAQKMSKKH